MPFVAEIDLSDVRAKFAAFDRNVRIAGIRALYESASATLRRIQNGAYWTNRTGKTAGSFRLLAQGQGYQVVSRNPNAERLDQGTAPHIIEASGRALKFVVNGSATFRKRVHHPGTRPIGYEEKERALGQEDLEERLDRMVEGGARSAGLA